MIFLDTHVALWLYFGVSDRFSDRAKTILDQEQDCVISPLTLLEISYLNEIKRIAAAPEKIAAVLENEFQIIVDEIGAKQLVHNAHDLAWTRDPFDRLIAAHSHARSAQLLTRDEKVRQHCAWAIW